LFFPLVVLFALVSMNPERVLIWNVRGLNSSARQDSVRSLVASSKIDIICLQETKLDVVTRGVLLSALGSEFLNFIELPAVGASGGILVAWKQDVGVTGTQYIRNNSVSVQFLNGNGSPWWLTCVYGPQRNNDKILFLQELRNLRGLCLGPWMIAGDFNLIYKVEDKNTPHFNRGMMGRFRNLINDLALSELPLIGRKFTWSNQ
jgi:exonuclease III